MRWAKVLTGLSYFHQSQHIGKAFRPDKLHGYFNDLTKKTNWRGESDQSGIPICILLDGRRIPFVTTIVQKALGHWDRWILNCTVSDKMEFLKLTRWLQAHQDEHGGWPIWSELNIASASRYSAMTQGECVSALVRAWQLTDEASFAEHAKDALVLLSRPLENGGTAFLKNDDELFLEEAPAIPRSSILNGWVFALFGLYDFWLAFRDGEALALFRRSLNTLARHLSEYDAGYWTFYDYNGHLASPFYHDLHIHQMAALAMVDDNPIFATYYNRWLDYRYSLLRRVKAHFIKVIQKLKDPGEAVIVR